MEEMGIWPRDRECCESLKRLGDRPSQASVVELCDVMDASV